MVRSDYIQTCGITLLPMDCFVCHGTIVADGWAGADNNQVTTDLRSERAGFRVDFGQGGRVSGLRGQILVLRG